MHRLHALTFSLLLGGLAAVALFLTAWGAPAASQPPLILSESKEETGIDHTSFYTVHLPLAMRWYDPAYVSPFGIVMYGSVSDAGGLQEVKAAGVKWATTSLSWSAIEPTKGSRDWSSFDTQMQNAQIAGMNVFVLFRSNPSWAATLPEGPVTDLQGLISFAGAMAERYDCDGKSDAPASPCVQYWSFYAEPDHEERWGYHAVEYAAMISQVSQAIHNANPNARVLIGGLAYDYFKEDLGPFVREFLSNTLYVLNVNHGGAGRYLDAVAFHFYPISATRWPTIREKAQEIRGIMTDYGVGDLPLICPEMGYWSSPKFGSSEDMQAWRLIQMYVRSLSIDMQPLSWFKVFDDANAGSAGDTDPDKTSGLLRLDSSYKPAYYAYQTLIAELARARYARQYTATGIEGYVFTVVNGKEKTVLWSLSSTRHVIFPYARLRLVNYLGEAFDIQDGQTTVPGDLDGKVNGQIELEIYENQPFYVEQK